MSDATPTVLFDLDGTLLDSTYLHAVAWSRSLRRDGHTVPMAHLHRLVGMGGDHITVELLGRKRKDLTEAEATEYEGLMDEVMPLPGARDLVRRTHDAGLQVVIATSSPQGHLQRLLHRLDADQWIDAITSADDADRTKPSPDIFAAAIRKVGAQPESTLVVGDTAWDIEAARRLGIDALGLLSGGWSTEELIRSGAVEVYLGPQELLERFGSSRLGLLSRSGVVVRERAV